MADLSTTLMRAAQADRSAEQQLNEWTSSNYGQLAKALATEISAPNKPLEVKQMACLYLKNTIAGKSLKTVTENHNRWKALDSDTRAVVKESLLQAMRLNEPGVPHFAAVTAAEVACVELPYQEWPSFVPALTENLQANQPPAIQQAALECFGYTLERIAEVEETLEGDVPELPAETVDKMLTSIVAAVQAGNDNDAVRLRALKALANALVFVRKNMNIKEERDFIMKHAIIAATQAANADMRALAFQCLDQVGQLYYEHLCDYMTEIFQLSTAAMQNDPEDAVKMAAIEFWSTIAEAEQQLMDEEEEALAAGQQPLSKCQKYTELALSQLVPILLQMLVLQDENADDDELNLPDTAGLCLEMISQTVRAHIIPLAMPFVQQHINSENWHYRDAAIVAFTSILDGPSTDAVRQFVAESIPVLLRTFSDPHETVRQSAVYCISQICKLHVMAIQAGQVHGIMQAVALKLQESPRVASSACGAIYNIARSIKTASTGQQQVETNELSPVFYPLLNALFQVSDREDVGERNLRGESMEAAAELIAASAKDVGGILCNLLPTINDRAQRALKMPVVNSEDHETKVQILGYMCVLYNALFQRFSKDDVMPHTDRIMENLIQILMLQNASVCHDEAFMAMGNLAMIVEQDFVKYLDHVVPLVIAGIRNFEAVDTCKVSIGTLVDICSAVGGEIQRFCDQIMTTLMEGLKDTTVHRMLKPVVISCLGDIAMAICGAFEPYLQVTTMLLMQAAQQNAPADNEEMVMFINELRFSVLEAYSGILVGLVDGNKMDLFLPNVQNIMAFLEFLLNPASNRDDEVLKKAVMLLGDIAKELGSNQVVKGMLRQPFVMNLLRECSEIDDEESRSTANWTHQQILTATQA